MLHSDRGGPRRPFRRVSALFGRVAVLLAVCAGPVPVARAQSPLDLLGGDPPAAVTDAPPKATVVEVADHPRATPRGSMELFVSHASAGEWREAATWIAGGGGASSREQLAQRLWEAVEASGGVRLLELSEAPDGLTDDGLPADQEVVARVAVDRGIELVRMVRVDGAWMFAPATAARVNAWHDALTASWLRTKLPGQLFRIGPRGLLYWQWLALPLLLLVAWPAGRLLAYVLQRLAARFVKRTGWSFDDALVGELAAPLRLFTTAAAASGFARLLVSGGDGLDFLVAMFHAASLVALFWALLRGVDVGVAAASTSAFVQQRPESRAVLQLGSRAAKVLVAFIGAVVALQLFGVPVTSLLAGLGLGGLAFALAAQKTVENVFGSVTLGVDQPFRPGDFVKIEDFVGTVESVGLRSTRIRTLDRTLITLPNGKLSDMRIESFAARDKFRLFFELGLSRGTTPAQLRAITADLRKLLEEHPNRDDNVVVFFKGFGDSALLFDVMAWFKVPEWRDFQFIRHDLLMRVMEIVERHGSSIAFPTRTVQHVWPEQSGPPPARRD